MGLETALIAAVAVSAGSSIANGVMGATAAGKAARANREMLAAQRQANAETLDLQETQQQELTDELILRQGIAWDSAVRQTKRDLTLIANQNDESIGRLRTDEAASLSLLRSQTGETMAGEIKSAGERKTLAIEQIDRSTGIQKTQIQRGTDLLISQARSAYDETQRQVGERLALARENTDAANAEETQRAGFDQSQMRQTADLAAKEAQAQQEQRDRKLRIVQSDAAASAAGRGVVVGSGSAKAVVDRNAAFAAADDRAAAVQNLGVQSLYRSKVEQRGIEAGYAIRKNEEAYQGADLAGRQAIETAGRTKGDAEAKARETLQSGNETLDNQQKSETQSQELTYAQVADQIRREGRQRQEAAALDSNQRVGAAVMDASQRLRSAGNTAATNIENLANSINAQLGSRALEQKQFAEEGELKLKWSDILGALDVKAKNDQLSIQGISSLVSGFGGAASALYSGYRTASQYGLFGMTPAKKAA